MKNAIIFNYFLICLNSSVSAQVNLVPNPSFEDTVFCPSTISEIFKADNWYSFRGSPDYYHTCNNSINGVVGVPLNNLGYQNPHSGLSYAGLIPYDLTGAPYREYLAVNLINPLSTGQKYFVTFFVNWLGSPGFGIANNKFGIVLTNNFYSTSNPYPISNNPKEFSDSIFHDSLGWSMVQLSFIADSNYQYLLLGNFFDDANTDTIHVGQFNSHSYYYVDDVCLTTDSEYSVVWTGKIENIFSSKSPTIFPNPVHNKIYIKNMNKPISYILFSLRGEIIDAGTILNKDAEIDVSYYPNDFYILKLDERYFYKIIINH